MKIFYKENTAQEPNTVCLNKEVQKIIQHLNKTGKIIGDDDLIVDELKQAKDILDNLIVNMQDENKHLVYYSGSVDDFLKKENRIKKEHIDVICDNYEEMDAVSTIMGFAEGVQEEIYKNQPIETDFKIRYRTE